MPGRPFGNFGRLGFLVLILASCSGGEGPADLSIEGGSGQPDQATVAGEGVSGGEPLDAHLRSVGYYVDELDDDEVEAAELQMFDEIGRCMAGEGFEWKPPSLTADTYDPNSDPLPELSDGYLEVYGLGISTWVLSEEEARAGLTGRPPPLLEPEVDPNAEYLGALSAEEILLYNEALLDEVSGCVAIARSKAHDVANPNARSGDVFFGAFREQLDGIGDRIQADGRMLQFEDRSRTCVRESGYSWFVDHEQAFQYLSERLDDVFYQEGPTSVASEGEGDIMEGGPIYSEEFLERLRQLQAEEIGFTKTLVECDAGFDALDELWSDLRLEYERLFVEEYSVEIDEFVADQSS